MRLRFLCVAMLAVTLGACGGLDTPSAAQLPTVETTGEPDQPSATAKAPAGTGGGRWVVVEGDNLAEIPEAAAANDHVVVLNDAPLCYIPEGPGGMDPVPEPPLAWVFNPVDGRFEEGAELDTVRTDFAVASLPGGRMLVAGGFNDEGVPKSSTRIWSAGTGEWSEGPLMTIARGRPEAVTLQDGRVLVIGGETPSGQPTARTEIYDPGTNSWARTGPLPQNNQVVEAVTLATGEVLAIGVTDLDGVPVISSLYEPSTGMWRSVADPPRPVGHPVAMPDGSALFFGGDRKVLRLDPDRGWSEAGSLLVGRGGAAIALLENGRVLLAGGYAGDPAEGTAKALKTAELFDPATGQSAPAPSLPRPRLDAAAIRLGDGSVLVAGGVEDANNGDTPWCPTVADAAFRWVP